MNSKLLDEFYQEKRKNSYQNGNTEAWQDLEISPELCLKEHCIGLYNFKAMSLYFILIHRWHPLTKMSINPWSNLCLKAELTGNLLYIIVSSHEKSNFFNCLIP